MLAVPAVLASRERLRALIVDGRNNHDWRATTPLLRQALLSTTLFKVEVPTAPQDNTRLANFRPPFENADLIVLNYSDFGNDGAWPQSTQEAFADAVRGGTGVVAFHAAASAFPFWPEYNEIIGLGGWGGRDERSGPYVRFRDGERVEDRTAGKAGHHGEQREFAVEAREPAHPVLSGLPRVWMHAKDELYDSMRGPARNLEVLATAWADPAKGGSGEHEPVLFTVRYGRGRVFHTLLGHGTEAMQCAGFQTTLQRGAEWAATGRVTQPVPADFPTSTTVRLRAIVAAPQT
jgi:type 1 glutamine amidotransferase